MNKKIFGVCDPDKSYAGVLAHFINSKVGDRFDVMAFSKIEALEDYLKKGAFDVALISEAFINSAEDREVELDGIPREMTFVLSDEREDGEYAFPSIYKYQSSENILTEIMSAFDKRRPKKKRKMARTKVIGVFSPIKRCGKTRFSMSLASVIGEKMQTLFISLEDISGIDFLKKEEGFIGLSDLLYKYTVDENDDILDTLIMRNHDGYDCILNVSCPEDIRNADCSMLAYIISQLQESGEYRCIVIDVGDELCEPEKILDACDVIYMPSIKDDISEKKMEAWKGIMRQKGCIEILDSCTTVNVPKVNVEGYTRALLSLRHEG